MASGTLIAPPTGPRSRESSNNAVSIPATADTALPAIGARLVSKAREARSKKNAGIKPKWQ
jgi:hypothetical protein